MTDIQRDTLRFVYWFRHEKGFSPTLRELVRAFGLKSTNAAHDRLKWLEKQGMVTHIPKAARTLTVTERGLQALGQRNDPWPFFEVEE